MVLKFSNPPFGPLRARPIAFKEFPGVYFWTWMVMDMFFGQTPLDGWEEVSSIDDDEFLILCSQLGQVAAGMSAQGSTGRYFARSEDLEFARRFPVLLAHQAAAAVPPEKPAEAQIGTHALILEGNALRLCTLESLDEAGTNAWTRLKQGTTLIPLRGTLQGDQRTAEDMATEHAVKAELWERAQPAARELAIQYWQLHQEMKNATTLSLPRALPPTTSVLRGQGIIIPQLDSVEGVLLALSHAQQEKGGWKEINTVPTYTHQRPTSVTEVTVRPRDVQLATPDLSGQLWQRIRQFNDVDGDIVLALLAQLAGAPRDARGGAWITGQQILEYRGIKPKTHKVENRKADEPTHRLVGHRYEDLQEIAEGVSRIRDMHITVRAWHESHKRKSSSGKQTRRRIYQQESYLITISDFIQQSQLVLEGEQLFGEPLAVAWYYQPGTSLEGLLTSPNYRAAYLLQQALRYDPLHERWEKRLARYFTFQLRMNPDFGGSTIKRTIGGLIDELALTVNESDPKKTKERFERAMDRLKEDGIISSWGPEDRYQRAMDARPRYGWIKGWLEYELEISADSLPPKEAGDLMEHLQVQRKQQRLLQRETKRSKEEQAGEEEG
jgi:hypothetical protein